MKPNPSQDPSWFITKSLLTTRSEAEDCFQRWVGTSALLLLVPTNKKLLDQRDRPSLMKSSGY
jgi:hypothetical protein